MDKTSTRYAITFVVGAIIVGVSFLFEGLAHNPNSDQLFLTSILGTIILTIGMWGMIINTSGD